MRPAPITHLMLALNRRKLADTRRPSLAKAHADEIAHFARPTEQAGAESVRDRHFIGRRTLDDRGERPAYCLQGNRGAGWS